MSFYFENHSAGGRELIRVDFERQGRAVGKIVASDFSRSDCGCSWSGSSEHLKRAKRLQEKPKRKFKFKIDG